MKKEERDKDRARETKREREKGTNREEGDIQIEREREREIKNKFKESLFFLNTGRSTALPRDVEQRDDVATHARRHLQVDGEV